MKNTSSSAKRIFEHVRSKNFFYAIIALLVLEAGWIALTGRFPMAFDENYHFGLIKLYSHRLLPFWSGQPAGADAFGAVARDPSYIYHYVLSFPYRIIAAVTTSEVLQVLILRAINIGLFAWGVVLYSRLLLKSGAGRGLVNLSMLVFVLVPVVSQLAAQINYDNFLLPLTALVFLFTLKVIKGLTSQPSALDVKALLGLICLILLTSLVKYAFLPIAAVIVFYLVVVAVKAYSWDGMRHAFLQGWQNIGKTSAITLIATLLVLCGMFAERYGVNLLNYHKPVVDCSEVLNYEHCKHYGPWLRDYNFKASNPGTDRSPLSYTQHWFYGMWLRSFFAVAGEDSDFETRGPMPVPGVAVIILAFSGSLAFVMSAKRLWRNYNKQALTLFFITSLFYVAVLWVDEYRAFLRTGQPVAINGRYLLPVLPFLILFACLGVAEILRNRIRWKLAVALLVAASLLWGGGALTYVLRSSDGWYWRNSVVKSANHAVKNTLGPLTPGYKHPVQFLH